MLYFADTSALLNGCAKDYDKIWTSPLIASELENIKTSASKDEYTKYLARQLVRDILFNEKFEITKPSQRKIDHFIKWHPTLSNINDHRILATACLLRQGTNEDVTFLTSDGSLYILACGTGITPYFYEPKEKKIEEYCGWRKIVPTEEQLVELYSHIDKNIFNAKTNEFIEIYVEDELKDIQFWDGNKYTNLKYHNIKNPYTGEIIKPRNLEQKMAFHLLQNQDIKVKLLTAAWGSGKTMIALNYALEQISKGYYDKLVFVRNNIIAAGTNDIGYLPGDVRDKLSIFARCIADHVGGEEELDRLMDEGIIETVPLSHIRGRSIKHSIVLCDECENMDDKLTTLLMSRIEENSELIFCGDVAQIDKKMFDEHNGIRSMLKNLAGEPLFGTVKLVKSERSEVAKLCDKMIPPK
jgi:PhoH-like ATPase